MDTRDILTILPIAAGVITGLLALFGAVAEKTKNTTDNEIVKWARLIWSFIPIGQMSPSRMGKAPTEED